MIVTRAHAAAAAAWRAARIRRPARVVLAFRLAHLHTYSGGTGHRRVGELCASTTYVTSTQTGWEKERECIRCVS